jgi:hypothetical protein
MGNSSEPPQDSLKFRCVTALQRHGYEIIKSNIYLFEEPASNSKQ